MSEHFNIEIDTVMEAHPGKPFCVEPGVTVREVFEQLKAAKVGKVLVCQDSKLIGIFTERDALRIMAGSGDLDVLIEDRMIPNPVTVSKDDTIGEAIRRMSQGGFRRVPVVDDAGHPVGVVTVRGILHYLVEHFPKVIYNLPPTPHHAPQQREGA